MPTSYLQISEEAKRKLQKNLNQNRDSVASGIITSNKPIDGLSVNGIGGKQTSSILPPKGTSNDNKSAGGIYNRFTYDDYVESDTVSQAKDALNSQLGAKPGDYQSTWQGQIGSIIDKILNREEFSYDLNSDALYQQYKDQYTQLGKLAMTDTMGQAAAMTGGYGSSYATTAGNQAYHAYLSRLNEVVPELYGMALDRYNQEGEELYNNYALLSDQEQQEYSRYQDEYSKWLNETQLASDRYDTERNFDYSKYINERDFDYGVYADDKSYSYNEYRNAIADAQWQQQFNLQQEQWEKEFGLQQDKWNTEKAALDDSSKSYSGTTSSGKSYNNGSLTNSQVKALQAALGVDADGYFGADSKKAAGGLSAEEAYAKYVNSDSSSGSSSGNGSDNKDTNSTNKTSGVSDNIRKKLDSFESNTAVESYLESLEASGAIDHETALQLMSEYMDVNEVYIENEDKTKSASYKDMVKSTNGWIVVSNGGTNWFWGIDNNAIVKAPNGEQIRLDNLVDKLVSEGMSKSDAKSYVEKLQKNLKI